jgi:uncharacterized protein
VTDHPNLRRLREGFEGFRRGDVRALLDLFAADAVWHVPGANAMAGDYRGPDEIVAFLRRTGELTAGTYQVDLLWALADEEHAVVVYRARGRRPDGRELDVEQALLVEIDGGSWRDVRAVPFDQAAFDAFWAS